MSANLRAIIPSAPAHVPLLAPGTFPPSLTVSPTLDPTTISAELPTTDPVLDERNNSTQQNITYQPCQPAELRTWSRREVKPPSRLGEWGDVALVSLDDYDNPSSR